MAELRQELPLAARAGSMPFRVERKSHTLAWRRPPIPASRQREGGESPFAVTVASQKGLG
jgi:hypothetical protein